MARAYGSSAHLLMKRETVYGQAATGNYLACRSTAGSVIEVRTITKPVAGTVKVYLDGVEQLSGWSVDTATGLVIFGAAPALGSR
jgi:uncharacterized protein (TIGR02217 family)